MAKRILKIGLIVLAAIVLVALVYMLVCYISYRSISETGLPRIEITTENGEAITSKEDYVNCTVNIVSENPEHAISNATAGIRGRGNDTWLYYPKKPYRIKFDEKTSVFGETKNKSWVLLAMYNDFSMIKDNLAFNMADALDNSSFAPATHYVELYLNGSYRGLYLLTDQVDENKGRTGVKTDFDENDVEVPFLVELDARAPDEGVEGVDWFSVSGREYAIKYPEADERYSPEQFEYIKEYIEKVDSLCRKPNVTIAELSEYIDVKSFIDFYLVQETMGQTEINWKSVYMSKAVGEKLVMGPVWDFDWSVTGPYIGDFRGAYRGIYDGFRSTNNWFRALYDGSPEFRTALCERFNEVKGDLNSVIETADSERVLIAIAAKKDRMRWHWYRLGVSFESCSDEVIEWCKNRIGWLDGELNK